MLRLYVLREYKGGPVVRRDGEVAYFADKMDAKRARDAIGGNTVVSRGPDNRNRGRR